MGSSLSLLFPAFDLPLSRWPPPRSFSAGGASLALRVIEYAETWRRSAVSNRVAVQQIEIQLPPLWWVPLVVTILRFSSLLLVSTNPLSDQEPAPRSLLPFPRVGFRDFSFTSTRPLRAYFIRRIFHACLPRTHKQQAEQKRCIRRDGPNFSRSERQIDGEGSDPGAC